MFTGAHVTLTAEGMSLTIVRTEEEIELCAISGKYRSPKIKAYNLNTALRLLKGWIILNASIKEEEEFKAVENTLFDELGGEVMSDQLTFFKYAEFFRLVISPENKDEWICINAQSGERLYFKEGDFEFVRYSYFKKYDRSGIREVT